MWAIPPADVALTTNQADIWRINLTVDPDLVQSAFTYLSADEAQRASRFHFETDRDHFVVAHACLRRILARYLPNEPRSINFSVNEYGKPFLPNREVQFSLSHSGEYALVGVIRERNIGVDVEQIRTGIEIESLAGRYFSPLEVSEWMALPPEQRTLGFFNGWTRKEACIKAQGMGLSLPFDSFDVSLAPDEPAVLRATRPDPHEAARWTLLSLDIDSDHAGAAAVDGERLNFNFWGWNEMPAHAMG